MILDPPGMPAVEWTCATCHDPFQPGHRCTTGADLAAEREAAGLRKADLARAWPCSKGYIKRVEDQAAPTAHTRAKYRLALEKGLLPF